jgi:hypothetical protein
MSYIISDNYVICFRPLRSNYAMEFEGWPTKGSTAAPSHSSEGWYEKVHTSAQYPDVLSIMGLLKPCSSPGWFTVQEFFSKKKATSPQGRLNDPGNSPNQLPRNFEAGH